MSEILKRNVSIGSVLLQSELEVTRLEVIFRSNGEITLPEELGSTLRGTFGHAIKETFCDTGADTCNGCILRENCGYATVFEFDKEELKQLGFQKAPNPYVILPGMQRAFQPGSLLNFNLTFFGPLPFQYEGLLFALHRMADRGLGSRRSPFELYRIYDRNQNRSIFRGLHDRGVIPETKLLKDLAQSTLLQPERSALRFRIETPLRLTENGETLTQLNVKALLSSIQRRYYILNTLFGLCREEDLFLEESELNSLLLTTLQEDFKEWKRYSNRKQRKTFQNGITGDYILEPISRKLRLLFLASEILHIGKNTTFGQGAIRIIE